MSLPSSSVRNLHFNELSGRNAHYNCGCLSSAQIAQEPEIG
jgi:hypothetical protein